MPEFTHQVEYRVPESSCAPVPWPLLQSLCALSSLNTTSDNALKTTISLNMSDMVSSFCNANIVRDWTL